MRTVHVDANTLEVRTDYAHPEPVPEHWVEVELPDHFHVYMLLEGYRTETGELSIRYNAAMKEARLTECLKELRERREKLLQESDWTALTDVQMSAEAKTSWAAYRQALRDLPQTVDVNILLKGIAEIEFPALPTS